MSSKKNPNPTETPSSSTAMATDVAPPPTYNASAGDQPFVDGQAQPPPPQVDEPDVAAAFANLKLSNETADPDADTCLAHLKLLFAIQNMKEEVGYTDGLWGIWDSRADTDELDELVGDDEQISIAVKDSKDPDARKLIALSKLREKRWALFVARAVDRYESWWASLPNNGALTESDMEMPISLKHAGFVNDQGTSIVWRKKMLPPLGTASPCTL